MDDLIEYTEDTDAVVSSEEDYDLQLKTECVNEKESITIAENMVAVFFILKNAKIENPVMKVKDFEGNYEITLTIINTSTNLIFNFRPKNYRRDIGKIDD